MPIFRVEVVETCFSPVYVEAKDASEAMLKVDGNEEDCFWGDIYDSDSFQVLSADLADEIDKSDMKRIKRDLHEDI